MENNDDRLIDEANDDLKSFNQTMLGLFNQTNPFSPEKKHEEIFNKYMGKADEEHKITLRNICEKLFNVDNDKNAHIAQSILKKEEASFFDLSKVKPIVFIFYTLFLLGAIYFPLTTAIVLGTFGFLKIIGFHQLNLILSKMTNTIKISIQEENLDEMTNLTLFSISFSLQQTINVVKQPLNPVLSLNFIFFTGATFASPDYVLVWGFFTYTSIFIRNTLKDAISKNNEIVEQWLSQVIKKDPVFH